MPEEKMILLVEDRQDDVVLIQRAFVQANVQNPIQVVRDGEEAMAYLAGAGEYSDRTKYPMPDLVLLDLKLPKIDGFELLKWIRKQPGLCALRVVVLTSSEDIFDIAK